MDPSPWPPYGIDHFVIEWWDQAIESIQFLFGKAMASTDIVPVGASRTKMPDTVTATEVRNIIIDGIPEYRMKHLEKYKGRLIDYSAKKNGEPDMDSIAVKFSIGNQLRFEFRVLTIITHVTTYNKLGF